MKTQGLSGFLFFTGYKMATLAKFFVAVIFFSYRIKLIGYFTLPWKMTTDACRSVCIVCLEWLVQIPYTSQPVPNSSVQGCMNSWLALYQSTETPD